MKTKEICAAADWLAANPDKHTTTVLARDARNQPVDSPFDPNACQFCAYGRVLVEVGDEAKAIFDRYKDDPKVDIYKELDVLTGLKFVEVYDINDGNTVSPASSGKAKVIEYLKAKAAC